MAKYVGYKRPKDTKKTIRHLLVYLGMHKWSFLLVALLVLISAGSPWMPQSGRPAALCFSEAAPPRPSVPFDSAGLLSSTEDAGADCASAQ